MTAQPRNIWIPLLIAGIIGCGLLASMFFPPYMVWAGVMMAMFGAILLGHPRHLLFSYWLWVSFLSVIAQISNNSAVRYADELLSVALIGISAFTYIKVRKTSGEIRGLKTGVMAFLSVVIASLFVNRSPIANAVNFLLSYFPFPFVFYVTYTMTERRHWRYLFGAIVGLMLIQFAMNIGWRLGVNPLPNEWVGTANIADMAQGTFGSSAYVAYFTVAVFFLLFSALSLNKKYRPYIILLLGVAATQLYITYTNHAYVYFALLLPIYLIISKASVRMRLTIGALLVLGAVIFVLLSSQDTFRAESFGAKSQLEDNFDQQNLERRWDKFVHGPKIELITRITVANATKEPFLWLLGNGPGYGLSAVAMERGSDFAWEYLGAFVANTQMFRAGGMTSITGSFYSGILSVWSELGVVGYILYMGLYIYAIRRVIWRLLRNQYTDLFQQVLAEGFVMAMLLFLLVSLLTDIFWGKSFTAGLWIWAAMVWDPVAPEDGEQRSEISGQTSAVSGQKTEALNQKNSKTALVANGWQRPPLRK
jgi:hypothetical protein